MSYEFSGIAKGVSLDRLEAQLSQQGFDVRRVAPQKLQIDFSSHRAHDWAEDALLELNGLDLDLTIHAQQKSIVKG